MAKAVEGYLSDDGNFFPSLALAKKHDAEMSIRSYCVSHTPRPIDSNVFLSIIEALADPIMEYVNASKAEAEAVNSTEELPKFIKSSHDTSQVSEARVDQRNAREIQGPSSILKQPVGRDEPMPDIRGSTYTESLRDERQSNGSRSRKRDA